MDFLETFDTVRHSTLMDKMAQLALQDQLYNWIRDFSTGIATVRSSPVKCLHHDTASVIQGSSLGPVSYIVNAADLCCRLTDNAIMKFADDTCLIIPAANSHTRNDV